MLTFPVWVECGFDYSECHLLSVIKNLIKNITTAFKIHKFLTNLTNSTR